MKKLEAIDELIKIEASGDLPSDEIETARRELEQTSANINQVAESLTKRWTEFGKKW